MPAARPRASTARTTPEERRVHRFQTRVAVCAGGGEVCDGWILGVVGTALPLARADLALTSLQTGLIGAATLVGIFFGGIVFGRLTDRFGRQKMYLFDLLVFLVGSVLQLAVDDALQLFAVRLLMGVAVGADYAIAGALVAEFAPPERRGRLLASLIAFWYVGYTLAAAVGMTLASWSTDPTVWRWILASSAVPSLVVLVARLGTPESPHWLASRGRYAEADAISRRWLGTPHDGTRHDGRGHDGTGRHGTDHSGTDHDGKGAHRTPADQPQAAPAGADRTSAALTGLAALFARPYRRMTAFTSLFWLCQITPFFAISTFAPQVLASLGAGDDGTGEVALNLFLLLGCVSGVLLMDRVGRRPLLVHPFLVTAAALLALGLWPHGPQWAIAGCFAVFALFHAASSTLQAVYPSEVFPTEIRATGIGFAAATSRIGGAVGTFLVPLGLEKWGVSAVVLCGCALSLVGALVSVAWAPETSGLSLSRSSAPYDRPPRDPSEENQPV
ncbi:MFS transporter [Streptomyces sp. AMCC400023]|uniref:MFS transporter n=1 Tax=Streptomyces sp. AMCC400023 TaxID=2056258 RepID=UPI001F28EFE8|nr:MFS transporter [Streptomyces sp. AMCC400023]UJV45474.1 MFS transporter [Streptomyces sp. AMCC400023]